MTLQPRDRRALAILAPMVILTLVYELWPSSGPAPVVAPAADSIALAERRLGRLRESAASVPGKEEVLKKVSADLAAREKGLLQADTLPQAQAQLIQIVRNLGKAENPPVEIRATEGFGVQPFGDAYGEASVSVQIECRIDQLVNLLAAITAQSELVSINDVRISAANPKEKLIGVRLTISGIVPRKLVPQKKGSAAF
jgi:Type II secretion system (T2SS), protein M subtype b